MTQFLPPNLLALFAPRDPIPFLPQLEKLPHEKHHNQPYCGIAPFIRHFEVLFEIFYVKDCFMGFFIILFFENTVKITQHMFGQKIVACIMRSTQDIFVSVMLYNGVLLPTVG